MSALAAVLLLGAAQWPTDAREVVAWHAARAADDALSAPRAEEWRERLFVYQGAGAEAEAWEAVAALARLAPGDPDAERYRIQLSAWDPAQWEDGLARAEVWLRQWPQRSAVEREAVERARALLAGRVAARAAAQDRRAGRAWVPYGALGACCALAGFALRRPR